jgi:Rps23 Pro-64 3,4-dihydroxylase Tpa1-like proline 4-hydroxylase
MMSKLCVTSDNYNSTKPYPYYYQDNFLEESFATELQKEILNIAESDFDRYNNPFEQKYTLRDKYNFPEKLKKLFCQLESPEFVEHLSSIIGVKLIIDPTRNFWGVHKYDTGDYLDIHVDAGLHPITKQKKHVTLGIYLSYNWKDTYGCDLEIWQGTNSAFDDAKIEKLIANVAPMFNRLVLFTCNDYSWHGNPIPHNGSNDSKRIFVTISYLSENYDYENKRCKAFFVPRPNDEYNEKKDKLRFLRADPEKYKNVYNLN